MERIPTMFEILENSQKTCQVLLWWKGKIVEYFETFLICRKKEKIISIFMYFYVKYLKFHKS